VVLTAPVDVTRLRQRNVIRFADPAVPGRHLVHRIVAVRADGTLTTRGDANQGPDSTPVPLSDVEGLARLRIPYIGLPAVWLRDADYGRLAAGAAGLALTVLVLSTGGTREPAPPGGHRMVVRCYRRRGATGTVTVRRRRIRRLRPTPVWQARRRLVPVRSGGPVRRRGVLPVHAVRPPGRHRPTRRTPWPSHVGHRRRRHLPRHRA
jgi:hypothetical protein